MNELGKLMSDNPTWRKVFTNEDQLVGEAIVRFAGLPSISKDTALLLLLLAKATRLEHVALPLTEERLTKLITDELWRQHLEPVTVDRPNAQDVIATASSNANWFTKLATTKAPEHDPRDVTTPLVRSSSSEGDYLYLQRLACTEYRVASAFAHAATNPHQLKGAHDYDTDAARQRFRALTINGAPTTPEAQEAFDRLLTTRLSVLTGGPGTGKTTSVAAMLVALASGAQDPDHPLSISLCAPTAKAFVRMNAAIDKAVKELSSTEMVSLSEITNPRSGSVQRLLGMHLDTMQYQRAVDSDLVIVDEVSMLDLSLMDQLLQSCSNDTHILFVGDPHQLSSVSVGAALNEIVSAAQSEHLRGIVTTLTHNYRSDRAITNLAAAVNAGNREAVDAAFANHPESLTLTNTTKAAEEATLTWAAQLLAQGHDAKGDAGLATLEQHVVLSATREGKNSVAWWQERVRNSLTRNSGVDFATRFPVGTPVMVTKNERIEGIAASAAVNNGDVGIVVAADAERPSRVVFGPVANKRERSIDEIDQATFAWSITIHKSQGSEYDNVVVSLPDRDLPMLTRELLYTAITRARKQVTIIATDAQLTAILGNEVERVGGLRARLAAMLPQST